MSPIPERHECHPGEVDTSIWEPVFKSLYVVNAQLLKEEQLHYRVKVINTTSTWSECTLVNNSIPIPLPIIGPFHERHRREGEELFQSVIAELVGTYIQ